MEFDHLDLFRISDFEFRTFNSIYTWHPLRLCPSISLGVQRLSKDASHLFPECVIQIWTEIFKNLWLDFSKGGPSWKKDLRRDRL